MKDNTNICREVNLKKEEYLKNISLKTSKNTKANLGIGICR
jgi:hypothetical protein